MKKKLLVAAAISLIGFGFLTGCSLLTGRSHNPAPVSFNANKDVVRATLGNGLQVVIVPNRLAPVATSVLTYKVGSGRAPLDAPGLAHALQHLLFAGGPGLSGGQLTRIARALGGDLSAETTESDTRYIFTVPAGDLDVALHLQAIGMRGITSSENAWSSERQLLESEISADNTNPQYALSARLRTDLFKGTPYARDPLGSVAGLDKVTLAQLTKFYDSWYGPNDAILVVAGDVVPRKVLSEIRALFGGVARRPLPAAEGLKLAPVEPHSLDLTSRLAYGAAAIALRFPGRNSPDYPAALVLSEIIRNTSGGLSSLVSLGAAFEAGFTYDAFPRTGMGMIVAGFAPNGNGATVKDSLKLDLAKYMNGGISTARVEAAKLRAELRIEARMNSVSGLALEWASALGSGESSPETIVNAIARVTAAQVNRVAVRYVDLGKAEFATLTPAASGPKLPLSSQGYGGPEPIDLSANSAGSIPGWARSAVTELPTPADRKPVDLRLSNGLRLIIQPERNSAAIELYGLVNSSPYVQVPKGKGGVEEVLARLMSFGTSSMDKKDFQAALDKIGARESAGTSFSVEVLRTHFARGVALLADNLLHPAISTATFKSAQKLISQIVAARIKNPSIRAREAFLKAVLPPTDPALREATAKSVDALTEADVRSYYRSVFRPDMTTIVVIGDIDAKTVKSVVQRYLGGWRNPGKKPDILLPSGVVNKASVTTVADKSSAYDQVRLAELIPLVRSNPAYRTLQLGNEILSGDSYPGRFSAHLRAVGVPVSYLSSSFISGRSRTFYLIDYAADPGSVQQAAAAIRSEITELQKHPPTAAELARAKGDLLRSIVLSAEDYSTIADGLLNRSRLAFPLDEPALAAKAYSSLTPAEVSAAMAKWVRPGDLAEVIQGPSTGKR